MTNMYINFLRFKLLETFRLQIQIYSLLCYNKKTNNESTIFPTIPFLLSDV